MSVDEYSMEEARRRFHLVHALSREKNRFLSHLFPLEKVAQFLAEKSWSRFADPEGLNKLSPIRQGQAKWL